MLTSILVAEPAHPELAQRLTAEALGAPIVTVPAATLQPADALALCDDGHTLAIAYLSVSDLLSVIRQRQLHTLCVGLRERSPFAYLLIGGVLSPSADGKAAGWPWEAIQGALLTVQEAGVSVQHLQHAEHVPAAIERLARRARGPIRAEPAREALWYTPAELLLMALPGIGETLADRLLTDCGDAATALLALTDDTTAMPGIGPETRRKVRAVLGLRDGERLVRDDSVPVPLPKAA